MSQALMRLAMQHGGAETANCCGWTRTESESLSGRPAVAGASHHH